MNILCFSKLGVVTLMKAIKSVMHGYFSNLEAIISFGVDSVRFFYIVKFIIYHWNMLINLKYISDE
jgi:hypothetical protein